MRHCYCFADVLLLLSVVVVEVLEVAAAAAAIAVVAVAVAAFLILISDHDYNLRFETKAATREHKPVFFYCQSQAQIDGEGSIMKSMWCRTLKTISIPGLVRPGLTTAATSAVYLQVTGGNWATVD